MEPNKIRCPNPKCGLPKEANKAICPHCRERYCPRCVKPLKPDSRICLCRWVDPDFKSPAITTRAGSVSPKFSEFQVDKAEYACPKCNNPVEGKYDPCPNSKCGWLGPNVAVKFNRVEEETPFIPKKTDSNLSQAPRQHSAQSDIQQISKPTLSSQLEDSASKDYLRSGKLSTDSALVTEKARPRTRRDWDYHPEESSKAKIIAVVVSVVALVIVVASLVLIRNPDVIPRAIASLPKLELPKSEAPKPSLPQSQPPSPKPPVVEVAPPTMSNVSHSEVTESSVIITWVTSEPCTSQVEYGATTNYGKILDSGGALVISHKVTLNSLNASTEYHFKVVSKNAKGIFAQPSTDGTFITPAPPDTTPPVISGIGTTDVSDTTITIAWVTNEKATSQVEYGTSNSYGSTTATDENRVTAHSIPISGLEPNKAYYFKVKSRDASKNEAALEANQPFKTQPPVPTGPEVGKRAPDFTVYRLDGTPVTLSKLRGKIVMVNFWAIGCGACVAEMPDIEAVYKTRPPNLAILAINAGDHSIYIENFIKEEKLTLPIYVDSDRVAVKEYQIYNIPRTFFVDSSGIIRKIELGRFETQDEIREALSSLQ